ncbi:MAG TPA: DNA mismatch endonuclease Vsr [Terriglobia bacterium]|nr:DNA mismatch endonuclease Vsr [Terriglobia bacterium]
MQILSIDMDTLTKERRSWNMSRIRGRDTHPEKIVRSILHRLGYRFRLNRRDLPGKPDIVLPKHHTVVMVHGCFWHRHPRCRLAYTPKSNKPFWIRKFDQNVARDRKIARALRRERWRVIVVWECQVDEPARLKTRLDRVIRGSD